LQTLVSLVQRKVPDSSLLVTGSARCWKLGESRRASYSLESSSVANVGLARAEESARQPADGTWDQLAAHAGNWEKAGGHRTLANGIISWKLVLARGEWGASFSCEWGGSAENFSRSLSRYRGTKRVWIGRLTRKMYAWRYVIGWLQCPASNPADLVPEVLKLPLIPRIAFSFLLYEATYVTGDAFW
jgi:hypothetical protein